MKKILITGANGFLGANLSRFFSAMPEYSVVLTSQKVPLWLKNKSIPIFQGNLLDRSFVNALLINEKPDIIINTVSLVNVDLCEENPPLARQITVQTADILAAATKMVGSRMIYISTDQVFDGQKSYYTEEDEPDPINEYGKTKLNAERLILHELPDSLIIRTNFFGWSPFGHAPTFAEWVYQNLMQHKSMQLYTNFHFSPIEVTFLAEILGIVIKKDASGILNVCGSNRCSKFEFGMELAKETGLETSFIEAVEMNSLTLRAKRPKDMSLSVKKCASLTGTRLPDLMENIQRFIRNRELSF